jgi:hypothetical protein
MSIGNRKKGGITFFRNLGKFSSKLIEIIRLTFEKAQNSVKNEFEIPFFPARRETLVSTHAMRNHAITHDPCQNTLQILPKEL